MQPTPRYQEIVAVLRAILTVPGVGPHLSRYWQHCPAQEVPERKATGEVSYTDGSHGTCVPKVVALPPAFTFLEYLFLVAPEVFYALLAPTQTVRVVRGIAAMPMWQGRLAGADAGTQAMRFLQHIAVTFKVHEHYLATNLPEEFHRQCISAEVLGMLPWREVTVPWLVGQGDPDPWHRKRDEQTIQLLAGLIATSFRFNPRFATAFWDMVGVADLVSALPREHIVPLITRLRREPLSDALLGETFPIPLVVQFVTNERIERFLAVLWDWLGGSDSFLDEERRKTPVPRNGREPPPLPKD